MHLASPHTFVPTCRGKLSVALLLAGLAPGAICIHAAQGQSPEFGDPARLPACATGASQAAPRRAAAYGPIQRLSFETEFAPVGPSANTPFDTAGPAASQGIGSAPAAPPAGVVPLNPTRISVAVGQPAVPAASVARVLCPPVARPVGAPAAASNFVNPIITPPAPARSTAPIAAPIMPAQPPIEVAPAPMPMGGDEPSQYGTWPAAERNDDRLRRCPVPTHTIAVRLAAQPEEIVGRPATDAGVPFDDDIKPLGAMRTNLKPSAGDMPTDYARAQFGSESVVLGGSCEDRRPVSMVYLWDATALCFGPIYFDDVNLERYGYTHGVLEPFVSAIHFFGTIPILPYKMGVHPPSECIYTLGYYRPGTPAPYQTSRLPWSLRGAVLEATAIGAIIAWIPSGKFY